MVGLLETTCKVLLIDTNKLRLRCVAALTGPHMTQAFLGSKDVKKALNQSQSALAALTVLKKVGALPVGHRVQRRGAKDPHLSSICVKRRVLMKRQRSS